MFLQGNLQNMFDALYMMGVIDPVLKMDWKEAMKKRSLYEREVSAAVRIMNQNQGDPTVLARCLEKLSPRVLEFVAMEVAREFADYHSRQQMH